MSKINKYYTEKEVERCEGCTYSFQEFAAMVNDNKALVKFLQSHGIVKDRIMCQSCNRHTYVHYKSMTYMCSRSYTIKKRRLVQKMRCFTRKTIRGGTWLSLRKTKIPTIIKLCYYWLTFKAPRHTFVMNELNITSPTVTEWTNMCREVCILWVEHHFTMLGGARCTVEMGDFEFVTKSGFGGSILVGGYDRNTDNCFLVLVPERSAAVYLNVVQDWILPGSIIISKCWKAHNITRLPEYKSSVAKRDYKLLLPETNYDTWNVTRLWEELCQSINRCGTNKSHVAGFVAEFLFKRKHPNHIHRMHAFFNTVAELYPQ